MALVAHLDLELCQMDIKTPFLKGDIDDTMYMVQLENFESGKSNNMVCKLKKSIYGPKQASHQWYHKFHQVIISYGFEVNSVDNFVYRKFSGSKIIFLVFYVDDVYFLLGIQIHRHCCWSIIGLSQKNYIKRVLTRFGMKDCHRENTPIDKGDKFSFISCPKNKVKKIDEKDSLCVNCRESYV